MNYTLSEFLGKKIFNGETFTPSHEKHRLTITAESMDGKKKRFICSYQYNPNATKYKDGDGLCAVLSDAICFSDCAGSLDTFAGEFGYNKPSEAIRAFNGCRRAFRFFESLGLDADDMRAILESEEG